MSEMRKNYLYGTGGDSGMENDPGCRNCRYGKTVFDYPQGICHRHSPGPDGYPSTTADQACDAFRSVAGRAGKNGSAEGLRRDKTPSPVVVAVSSAPARNLQDGRSLR